MAPLAQSAEECGKVGVKETACIGRGRMFKDCVARVHPGHAQLSPVSHCGRCRPEKEASHVGSSVLTNGEVWLLFRPVAWRVSPSVIGGVA